MALVVEDGTGLSAAEAYISLADFKLWADARARAYTGTYDDTAIEAAIRLGFDYINTSRRYKAITLTLSQRGEFPRDGLTDWNGRAVTGVPQRVKDANAELAWAKLTSGADLYQDQDRGGRVASESVGPISVSYFSDAPSQKVFTAAMKLLDPYARSIQDSYPPFIGGAAGQTSTVDPPTELTPVFSIGMHTNSGD